MAIVTQEQVQQFAELSGDYNPLHIDSEYAYNSLYKQQVVHGVYQVFYVLNDYLKKKCKKFYLSKISVNFHSALLLGEEFFVEVLESELQVEFLLKKSDEVITTIKVLLLEEKSNTQFHKTVKYKKQLPQQPDFSKLETEYRESVFFDENLLKQMFYEVYDKLSFVSVGFLLATTRIVGMKFPGKNSIFSSINFECCHGSCEEFTYSISFHKILKVVTINLNGMLNGKLRALLRPEQVKMTPISQLKEFKISNCTDQKALVVGGSSGIGLQCVRMLSLNNASVLFSYYKNEVEAKKNVIDLIAVNKNVCAFKMNVSNIEKETFDYINQFSPTHLYYFATPRIIHNSELLNFNCFIELSEYYIFALEKIIKNCPSIKKIFLPSSTAIVELPKDMYEYSIVKYAMELFAFILQKKYMVNVFVPRLPRIETNQTQSVMNVYSSKAEDVLYEELNKFLG